MVHLPPASLEEMIAEINKYKLTIVGGPPTFANKVKHYLPKAKVYTANINMSKLNVSDSDYVVIYSKYVGHTNAYFAQAQLKQSGKVIYVNSINKYHFCKAVYEGL